jgi:4-carboxymuconolactone decarboxylase
MPKVHRRWRLEARREGPLPVDYTERLRRLAINDPQATPDDTVGPDTCDLALDAKTLALVQLAALIAVGGEVPSYGTHADAAVDAGATTAEIVDVLVAITPIVGLPRVVTAAPRLAMGLGYDTDIALEE